MEPFFFGLPPTKGMRHKIKMIAKGAKYSMIEPL